MFEIKNLLERKTVKNFLPKKVDSQILENAIRVAWKTPTSLNSRPVILSEISQHRDDDWIAQQPAVKTAPHLFLFAWNAKVGESNARKCLAERYESEIDSEKVNGTIQRIITNRNEWARQQIYLTAGYFAATLEASGVAGCFIAGFEKEVATKNLQLPDDYFPELVFACGFANTENPGSNETDFARSFDKFYFSKK